MSAQAEARGLRPERGIPLGATAMSRASRGSRASPGEGNTARSYGNEPRKPRLAGFAA